MSETPTERAREIVEAWLITAPDALREQFSVEDGFMLAEAVAAALAAQAAQTRALREALEKFGRHTALCSVTGGYAYPCTCGLAAALTGAPQIGTLAP